ncbi:MAG: tandem-95 repeat protein, partial [Emcibacter sp.]|nr:tandem-95 repeat protein [Emcibacter sp.]
FPSSDTENTEVIGSPVHTNIEQAEVKLSQFLKQDDISQEDEGAGQRITTAGTATSELEFEPAIQTGVTPETGDSFPAAGQSFVETGAGTSATTIAEPFNTAPVAHDDEGALDENETFTLNVLSNDTNINNNSLLITDAAVNDGLGAVSHDGTNITFNPGSAYDYLSAGETETVTITYSISDGEGGTDDAVLTLTVTGSNDGPVVNVVDLGGISEDSSVTFSATDLLANSTDVDGDSLSVMDVTVDAAYGTVTDNGDGTYTFSPAADYNGAGIPLNFNVSDGTTSTSGTAVIDVTAVNDGPVARDDVAETNEDNSLTIDVLANDTDVDGDSLSVTSATVNTGQGTVSINDDGTLNYDPGSSYDGLAVGETASVEISYEISDGQGGTATATTDVTVTGSNDAPVVSGPVTFMGTEDYTITMTGEQLQTMLLSNASDADGDTLVAQNITVDRGTITDNGDGTWSYVPEADFNGDVNISYEVSDGTTVTAASAVLDIAAVNDGPVASDGTVNADEDGSAVAGTLVASDVDGDDLSFSLVSGPEEGSVTVASDGSYSFDPGADFQDLAVGESREVSFTYGVDDGQSGTDQAQMTVTVNGSNDGPVIEAVEFDNAMTSLSLNEEGRTGDVAALSGLDDFPTDALTIQLSFSSNEPPLASETNGVSLVSYAAPGSDNEFLLFAQPNGNLGVYINGQKHDMDVGSHDLFDGENHDLAVSWDSTTGELSVYVDGSLTDTATAQTGHPIQAGGTLILGQEQDSVGGGFDSTQEFSGTVHSFKIFSEAQNPADGDSSLAFDFDFAADSPLDNAVGGHVFALEGGANILTLDEGTLREDSNGISGQVQASDIDGDNLSFALSEAPNEGAVTVNADGSFVFVPGADFQDLAVGESRDASFEIEVSDGHGGTDTQTVTVTVIGKNDGPVAEALTVATSEDNVGTGQLLASDIDGDNLSFTLSEAPGEGAVTINADGSFQFTPGEDFQDLGVGESRDVSFSYEVSDGHGGTATETVTVTVNGTNDAPVIGDITNVEGSLGTAEVAIGTAMSFNEEGRTGDVALVENLQDFPTDALTVELRFSSDEPPQASETNGVSLFSYAASEHHNEFLIFAQPNGNLGVYINGQKHDMDVDMDVLFDGDYHHLAVSWDSEDGELSVFVDGNLTDTTTAQVGNPIQAGGTFALGQEQDSVGGSFASNQQFSGKIADVQIFDESRDASLIQSDAATGGVAEGDSSLVHAYNFRSSDSDTVTDQGTGNDMSYSGAIVVEDAELSELIGETPLEGTEDGAVITGQLTATDVEGDTLAFSLTTDTAEGSVTIDANGNFEFDPGTDFQDLAVGETREVSFTYEVSDGHGGTDSATATVTVTGSNDGPVAVADTFSGTEDVVISGNVISNDTDIDGDSMSVVAETITTVNGGTVDINEDGTFSYTPAADFSGTDSFSYTLSDGTTTDTGSVTLEVAGVADAPILTVEDSGGIPITLKISGDHYDPNNVEDVGIGSPQFQVFVNGEAVIVDGQSTFTVEAERGDWELFRFEAAPGTDINSVEVKFVNDAYDGSDDRDGDGVIGEDRNLIVDKINIGGEANEAGEFIGGYTLEAEDAHYDAPNSDGYEVMPWAGTLTFDTSDLDMVAVASGEGDSAIALDINATVSDPSETLSVTISGVPDGAELSAGTDNGDGSWSLSPEQLEGLTVTPPEDYSGSFDLSISATSTDGADTATSSTTLTVAVSAVNNAPVAVADVFSGTEDQTISGNVLDNDSDVDGDSLSVVAETIATANGGTVEIGADGSFVYSPAENYSGEDSFSYSLSDGTTTDSGLVTLEVAAVNDGPIVGNIDLGATVEDTSVTFSATDLLANSSDVENDSLSVTDVTVDAAYGTITDNGGGTYTFNPAADYNGTDIPLSFSVSDGTSSNSATATIDVTAVADAPTLEFTQELEANHGQYDISGGGVVTIDASYFSVSAGYNSSHGFYIADSDGNPIGGAVMQDNVKDLDDKSITINTDDY